MKVSDNFKKVIVSHLDTMAASDPLFDVNYKNPKKNIDDCITYILNQVKQSGCNGFEDDEIFGMAIHYYDEENIEIGKPVNAKVVVNHHVQLTPEEIEAAKEKAMQSVVDEQKQKLTKKAAKPSVPVQVQDNLFDGL